MISYINPSQKSTVLSSSSDLLAKSIEFINNHAGWKGSNYRFASMKENESKSDIPFISKWLSSFQSIRNV